MEEYIKQLAELEAQIREATTPPNGQGSREISLGLTKLHEAQLWLRDAVRLRKQAAGEQPCLF